MSGNIIQNCITLSNHIYEEYNTSKLPKFIKKRKLNKRLKELESLINWFTNNQSLVLSKLVCDYAYVLASSSSNFRSCKNAMINLDGNGEAIFNIILNDSENITVIITPQDKDPSLCFVKYVYIADSNIKFTFIEKDVKAFIYTNSIEDIDYQDLNSKFKFTKDIVAKTIISDIDIYLKNIMRGKQDE